MPTKLGRWRDLQGLRLVLYFLAICSILAMPAHVRRAWNQILYQPPSYPPGFRDPWYEELYDGLFGCAAGISIIVYDVRRVRRERSEIAQNDINALTGTWADSFLRGVIWFLAIFSLGQVPVQFFAAYDFLIHPANRFQADVGNTWYGRIIMVAFWGGFGIAIILYDRRKMRQERAAVGLCAYCGYDLRFTPDRCPECGRVVQHVLENS